jgi:hypothetical protein
LTDDILVNACPDKRLSTLGVVLKWLMSSIQVFEQAEIFVLTFGNSCSAQVDMVDVHFVACKLVRRRGSRLILHALAPRRLLVLGIWCRFEQSRSQKFAALLASMRILVI